MTPQVGSTRICTPVYRLFPTCRRACRAEINAQDPFEEIKKITKGKVQPSLVSEDPGLCWVFLARLLTEDFFTQVFPVQIRP